MKEVNIKWEEIGQMSKAGIRRRVRKSDSKKWREEIDKLTTLSLYREYKKEIKEENIYDNRESSRVLFWARSNTLKLNDRNRHQPGGVVGCELCGEDREDQMHFILKCRRLEYRRNKRVIEKLKGESDREMLGNILFQAKGEDLEEIKNMLKKMWEARKFRTEILVGGRVV